VPAEPARLTRLTTLAVAVALVARLAFAFGYWVGKPLNNDEIEYLQLGRSVAAGQGFTYAPVAGERLDAAGYGRAPIYPFFISLVARVTSPATLIPALRAAQCLLGALAVWLIALVARRAAGDRAQAAAAWIAALYPPLVWLPSFLFSESLYVVLALVNVLVTDAFVEAGRQPRDETGRQFPVAAGLQSRDHRPVVLAGVLAGLAALTRPAHVFFIGVTALWLLARQWPIRAAVFAVAALLTIAPWTLRNYVTYGRPVLIASEGGITFWTGNHLLSPGEGDMAANPAIKLESRRLRDAHPGLSAEQLEPVYYREAFHTIAHHPLWWLGLEVRKFFYLWVPIGPSYRLHSWLFLYATWLSYGLVAPLGIVGLWRLARTASPPHGLLLLLASAVVACLVFLPQERFRIPVIDPALIVGAAALASAPRRRNSVS
jgi:hypothetical protein